MLIGSEEDVYQGYEGEPVDVQYSEASTISAMPVRARAAAARMHAGPLPSMHALGPSRLALQQQQIYGPAAQCTPEVLHAYGAVEDF